MATHYFSWPMHIRLLAAVTCAHGSFRTSVVPGADGIQNGEVLGQRFLLPLRFISIVSESDRDTPKAIWRGSDLRGETTNTLREVRATAM